MNVSKKKNISMILMLLLILGVSLLILMSKEWTQANWFVVLTFLINIALFIWQFLLSMKNAPFSFDMMFWLFSMFFFGLAPLLQHLTNTYTWNLKPETQQIWQCNLLVLLWSLCYMYGRALKQKALPCGVFALCKRIWNRFISKYFPTARKTVNNWKTGLAKKFEKPVADKKTKATDQQPEKATMLTETEPVRLSEVVYGRARMVLGVFQRNPVERTLDVLLVISVLITIYHIIGVGFAELFSRSTADMALGSNTTSKLILTHGLKNTVLFSTAFHVIRAINRKKVNVQTVLSVVCLLISCFPTAMSRNMMASFYGGMLVLVLRPKRRSKWFTFLIFAGLVLAFPAIDVFRYITVGGERNILNTVLASLRNAYLQGHYDAHQNTVSAFNYVNEFGITWGKQLLGALLFFVPRAIWPSKPVGTGHMMISALAQDSFTNVSASLMLEGYINFGVIGVIALGFLVGAVSGTVDKAYWKKKNSGSCLRIIYPFSMLQFFFLLRGDMMSGWAYMLAQVVVGGAMYLFVKYIVRKLKKQ